MNSAGEIKAAISPEMAAMIKRYCFFIRMNYTFSSLMCVSIQTTLEVLLFPWIEGNLELSLAGVKDASPRGSPRRTARGERAEG
jgi:hypothetical protein